MWIKIIRCCENGLYGAKSRASRFVWIKIRYELWKNRQYVRHELRASCGLKLRYQRQTQGLLRHELRASCGLKLPVIERPDPDEGHELRASCGLKYKGTGMQEP